MPHAYYNENDKFAAAWLRELIKANLIAPGEVDERSIEDVSPRDVAGFTQCHFFAGIGVWSYALRRAGWPDDLAVWTGSCPCQPLSSAGKRKGHADERHLWPAFYRLIAERKPTVVFGEQVASKIGREWFSAVRADLESLGYACGAADLSAAGVGAPHIRQRLYFVADAHGGHAEAEGLQRGQEHRQQPEDGGTRRMADTDRTGWGRRGTGKASNESREVERSERLRSSSVVGDAESERFEYDFAGSRRAQKQIESSNSRGFWSDAEWIHCQDGKYRPAKSGIFPLVAGTTRGMVRGGDQGAQIDPNSSPEARVMRLRGYGNALNAETAIAFIEAWLEVGRV